MTCVAGENIEEQHSLNATTPQHSREDGVLRAAERNRTKIGLDARL